MKWFLKILQTLFHGIKIAGVKIRAWFEFVHSDLKKYSFSWSLILLGSLMVGFVILIVFMSLSKTSIFPKDDERYDINTIYIGQMKDFCLKEFEANPKREEFESCIPKLDINKMPEVKIPTFKETLKLAPNLPYMMKNSSDPKIREASGYFRKGNYFVIGIKVPERYFSTDKGYRKDENLDREASNYNALTFKTIRFGFGCVNKQCHTLLTGYNENVSQIPLIRSSLPGNNSNDNIVWIFGIENESPHGIFLEDGIFISNSFSLYPTHLYYSLNLWGKPMFASIAFIALFLVSIFCAIILRKFFDYPAFSYFAGSTAFWFISSNLFILFPWIRGLPHRLFNIWLTLNFLLSILILNLAYARFKSVLNRKYILSAHILILGLVFFSYIYFKDLGEFMAVGARLDLIFACIAIMVSLGPLSFGIRELSNMLKNLKDPRLSIRLDYKRRIRELRAYAFVWLIFCLSYLYFAYAGLGTGNVGEFFSVSIGVILLLLTIMLHYTYSKELTHVTSDPLAELERLNKRKSVSELSEIVKDPFEGILLLLDMENSSGKEGRQKSMAMENLLRTCNAEANRNGYYANYVKPAGDDWKIIFIKKHSNIKDDLLEVTKFVISNYSKFEKIIKNVFDDSSIHISVFALSDYRIYINEKQEAEAGYRTIIDFSSKEADLMSDI